MGDVFARLVLSALAFYMALRGPKEAPYLRLLWLWIGLSMTLLEVLNLRSAHPVWVKWALVAVMAALGSASFARDECGQRSRYAVMWAGLREAFAGRGPFQRR